jgi:nicotinate-nucleotide pyrophosphorylase (carboxylating)
MPPFDVNHPEIEQAVIRALEEDIGSGDLTSMACVPASRVVDGSFFAREPMVVAGVELLATVYRLRGGVDELRIEKQSGASVEPDTRIAWVKGNARTLLECERVSLNFIQRLSGVATLAHQFAAEAASTKCRVLDTRKTTPGLRRLEKMAAAAGGVTNHRLGLFDAVLIKNNHITAAGGVKEALRLARAANLPAGVRVEIEVRTRQELDDALEAGAGHLLLDNLTPAEAAEWIRHINGRATVEISGGVTLSTVRAYAETGADFVSSGSITHSARSMDLNFRVKW